MKCPTSVPSLSVKLRRAFEAAVEKHGLYRVAKDAGRNYGNLNRYLRGKAGISLETANKLADYLGLELRKKVKRKRR